MDDIDIKALCAAVDRAIGDNTAPSDRVRGRDATTTLYREIARLRALLAARAARRALRRRAPRRHSLAMARDAGPSIRSNPAPIAAPMGPTAEPTSAQSTVSSTAEQMSSMTSSSVRPRSRRLSAWLMRARLSSCFHTSARVGRLMSGSVCLPSLTIFTNRVDVYFGCAIMDSPRRWTPRDTRGTP